MTPLTEAENKLIHACTEPNGCWHEWKSHPNRELAYGGWYKCERCGEERVSRVIPPNFPTPEYTNDIPFSAFLKKLFGEEEMWYTFRYYSVCRWMQEDTQPYYDNGEARFKLWLFHPDHRDRFLRLFLDFLGLKGVQRKFGWEKCLKCVGLGSEEGCSCGGSGRIPRPWLKAWKEEK